MIDDETVGFVDKVKWFHSSPALSSITLSCPIQSDILILSCLHRPMDLASSSKKKSAVLVRDIDMGVSKNNGTPKSSIC